MQSLKLPGWRRGVQYLKFWRAWISIIAPLILLAVPLQADTQNTKAMWCAYTILVCAVYWVCECTPLAITSLIPVIILPLAGVVSTDQVCRNYLKGTNMMFLAGLIMAIAVEHSGLHKRLALNIIRGVGTSRIRLMLGFMLCSMFLSMWISNTAATAMMVPIVDAIHAAINIDQEETEDDIQEVDDGSVNSMKEVRDEKRKDSGKDFKNILLLSCAYASNIGGTGVITGSPPNLVILSELSDLTANLEGVQQPLGYATWMLFAVPLMLINTVIAWGVLVALDTYQSRGSRKTTPEDEQKIMKILERKKRELRSVSLHELQVLILFIILVLLWFFRKPYFTKGWAQTEAFSQVAVSSATPAVLVVLFLFLLPSKPSLSEPSEALLDWNTVARRLPWGVILLLGGGFALADATQRSGLSDYIADRLVGLDSLGDWQLNLLITFITTFITEIASNTATANILVPILIQISIGMGLNPIYLSLSAAVCCSYAFMLPIATAPNAIVFSHSTMKTSEMIRTGFVLNILCIATTNFAINTWGSALFGLGEFPEWAGFENSTETAVKTALQAAVNGTIPSPAVVQ
eukprot:TRINITY_DN2401_c0_g3_i1.p1 TRINITY_DN2401_c0_g3~~TRINITY_DN2401_c0_g3_i1.p1  ORF type:complete len:577 (-),score=57.96 TRINITY_DN2401_c0_g3_i1:45-1775(-)